MTARDDLLAHCHRLPVCPSLDRIDAALAEAFAAGEAAALASTSPPCAPGEPPERIWPGWRQLEQQQMDDRDVKPANRPLDLDLLAKLASGEGGRRTGALRRAGYLEWQVTAAGRAALGISSDAEPLFEDDRYSSGRTTLDDDPICPGCGATRAEVAERGHRPRVGFEDGIIAEYLCDEDCGRCSPPCFSRAEHEEK